MSRQDKEAKDAVEWLSRVIRCWLTARVVAVKCKYRLTVEAREARALEGVLSRCASTAMMVADGREAAPAPSPEAPGTDEADALWRWDTNGNGRITCREARAHGIAPVRRGHQAWRFMRDGDSVVCECRRGQARMTDNQETEADAHGTQGTETSSTFAQ